MVDSSNKKIKDLRPYLKFFDFSKLTHKEDLILTNASVFDSLRNIEKVVKSTLDDTKQIANYLKGRSLEETLRNNWHFVHDHIQYQLDKIGVEQIRRPLRLIYDKKGDCDCFSTFFSSLLTNQGIEHSLRMTKYKADWQHVYVIVPQKHGKKEYYTLDAVLHEFDKEEPYSQKHDKKMNLTVLNGLGNLGNLGAIQGLGFTQEFNTDLLGLGYVPPSTDEEVLSDFLARLKQHLYNTKRIIENNVPAFDSGFVAELNYLLINFDNNFYGALNTLVNGQIGSVHGALFWRKMREGLGQLNGKISLRRGIKNIGSGIKKGANYVGNTVKKVGKAIIKYNPLTIAVRNGFYLAMRINFLNIAGKLYYGSLSEEEAQRQGLDMNEYRKLKDVFNKVKGLLVKIGAKESNFYKYFNKGVEVARRKGKIGSADSTGASDDTGTIDDADLNDTGEVSTGSGNSVFSRMLARAKARQGVNGLGVVATTGVTAASGVLATIGAWLKNINFSKLKSGFDKTKGLIDAGKSAKDTVNSFLPQKKNEPIDTQDQYTDIEPVMTAPAPSPTDIHVPSRNAYEPIRSESNTTNPSNTEKKSNMGLMIGGGIAAAGILYLALSGKSSKKPLNGVKSSKKTAKNEPVAEKTAEKTATKQKVNVKI